MITLLEVILSVEEIFAIQYIIYVLFLSVSVGYILLFRIFKHNIYLLFRCFCSFTISSKINDDDST